jgi:hypothetical protein
MATSQFASADRMFGSELSPEHNNLTDYDGVITSLLLYASSTSLFVYMYPHDRPVTVVSSTSELGVMKSNIRYDAKLNKDGTSSKRMSRFRHSQASNATKVNLIVILENY